MKIHFYMQISTVNNTFNIKTFACKNICYVNSNLQRKKAQVKQCSAVWCDILVSVDQCPCSVAQFTHPLIVSLQLPFGVFREQWANVEHLNCFHCNLMYFPGETLGTPVKISFSSPSPPSACCKSFQSLCWTLCCAATPQPRLAGGCKLVFSQFPTLIPKRLCWHTARGNTRMKSWGTAAL